MKEELKKAYEAISRKYWVVSKNKEDAEDGIHSAILYILEKPSRFDEVRNKFTYLRMVARSSLRSMRRMDSRRKKVVYYDSDQEPVIVEGEEFSFVDAILLQKDMGQICGIEDRVDHKVYYYHIKGLGKYHYKSRSFDPGKAIILSALGYSNKEISDMFGSDMDTVRYSINYFRKKYGLQRSAR